MPAARRRASPERRPSAYAAALEPQPRRSSKKPALIAGLLSLQLALTAACSSGDNTPIIPPPTEASVDCADNPSGTAALDVDTSKPGDYSYSIGDKDSHTGAWRRHTTIIVGNGGTFTVSADEASFSYNYEQLPEDMNDALSIYSSSIPHGPAFGAGRSPKPNVATFMYLCST